MGGNIGGILDRGVRGRGGVDINFVINLLFLFFLVFRGVGGVGGDFAISL